MNQRKVFPIAVLLLVAATFIGCVPKAANQAYILQKTIDNTHPRATLILGSSDLINKVVLTNVHLGQVGRLNRASVDIQNLTDNRYQLEYKFVWVDKAGFPVNPDMAMWHRVLLTPRKIKSVISTAPSPEGFKIRFTVRLPDDAFIEFEKQRKN